LHHHRMPAAKQVLLKGLSSSVTEATVSRKRPTCAATNDRKGVKPANIIAIDERPVSALLSHPPRVPERVLLPHSGHCPTPTLRAREGGLC
jgi:hypothetical protein